MGIGYFSLLIKALESLRVILGLDPRIHTAEALDPRVKPEDDGGSGRGFVLKAYSVYSE
jgi:hypothetical protein